jgi:GNAT superfamily N-acetyltransferase
MELRFAESIDLPAITALINLAFSVEASFKAGERITGEEIRSLFRKGRFLLLEEDGTIEASVYVEVRGDRGYLGLLSTNPNRQRSGIGARLMGAAEEFARESGCRFMDLRTVNLRDELPVLYKKFGYQVTGKEKIDEDLQQNFTKPAHFVVMSKELRQD